MTLVELLEKNAREIPEKSAVIFYRDSINYRQLNATVNKLANALSGMSLKKGDRVGLMLPRVPELIVSFLGVAKAGGIVVPINFELTSQKIRYIFETVSPQYIIVHSQFLDLAKESISLAKPIPIIVVGEESRTDLSWSEVLKKGKSNNPAVDVKEDDIVYLNYTSGSTGNPKGAVTTHSNIHWNTLAATDALGLTSDDIHLCMFASFAHPHEIIARPVYLGGTMVLVDKIYPKSLAEAISTHKVTCMMGLAPMYDKLLSVLKHKFYDLSSLRVPESGGMYTHPDLIERFKKEVGSPIIPVWGSTETTGIAIANRPGERILSGSVGKVCKSYEVKIVDGSGAEVGPGGIGEMIFKGPAVVGSYYNDQASNQVCFRDGWYYSGDLGKRDSEGNLYFMSRKTEMMKVAGLKVYPLEIELVSMEHPGIKEAAVIAAKDKLRGEVPRAVIVAQDGINLTEKEILKFWQKRLAHYKVPRIIQIRESLPKKAGNGKIDKSILRLESI